MGQAAEPRNDDLSGLYEQDLFAWALANADLLRAGRITEIDAAHIAEELEDMGKGERRALGSHLRVLIQHLLEWQYQPERRGTSWQLSILNARGEIEEILHDSPSLARQLPELIARGYSAAREAAALETHLALSVLPELCPFTAEQLLDRMFSRVGEA